MLQVLSIIFVLGSLIFIHELGHFLTAKKFGVLVHDFALGMGPTLFKKQVGETTYHLKLLPIGGFVRMEGENSASDHPRSFMNKLPYQKFLILFAGAGFNFIFAAILLFSSYLLAGTPTTELSEVVPESPAYVSGITAGSVILSIDDINVYDWSDIQNLISISKGDVSIVLKDPKGSEKTVTVTPTQDDTGSRKIGIAPKYERNPVDALKATGTIYKYLFTTMLGFFGALGKGTVESGSVVGPIGLFGIISEASQLGLSTLLFLMGYISINLGIVNLLPIPALDGGRIIFVIIEKIKGKPLNTNFENILHLVGFAALMILMVYLMISDISRL